MSWLDRLLGRARWDGRHGRPPSGNGASSFHLLWDLPPGIGPVVAAEATLTVLEPPPVPALFFWALQVSFTDVGGRPHGGGHLGLQWYPAHPGSTALNWGGYGADGRELAGSESALPSATGNVNTRDYPWREGRPYRLRVEAVGAGGWVGLIDEGDGAGPTAVRTLHAGGDRLTSLMVWSEVFADCDAPGAAVLWSDLAAVTADGDRVPVPAARVNYQALAEGGCATTDSSVVDGGVVQRTGTVRRTAQGARLVLS